MIKRAMLAVLVSTVGCQTDVPANTASFDQESRLIFGWVMTRTVGTLDTLALDGYGCYCGTSGPIDVVPIDATDRCCFDHDYAWVDAPKNEGPGCNCNTQSYEYSTAGGVLTCSSENTGCAKYCCEADQAFTECIKGTGVGTNRRYDRSQCEPIECKVDDDCEGGTWCDYGSCVPYCGGGAGFAACPTPEPTTSI
jgi:hypothetical protein